MCTVIEKYSHEHNNYYVFDIKRYPTEPDTRQIKSICREYNCQNLNGLLIGPYTDDKGFYLKAFDTSGTNIEPSADSMLVFNKYLSDKSYVPMNTADNQAIQTGMVMLL